MNSRRLVLICGLGHSGTTILDQALGCSPGLVGVGEAARVLDPDFDVASNSPRMIRSADPGLLGCTCGKSVDACPVWSVMLPTLKRGATLGEAYKVLFETALSVTKGASIVVDSTPGALRYIENLKDFDVSVIRLVRDVRSWSSSWARLKARPTWQGYRAWHLGNRKIGRQIAEHQIPSCKIGYEEFALEPEKTLKLICSWLGVAYDEKMLRPGLHSKSHIVAGNKAIKNGNQSGRIRYDGSWMTKTDRPLLEALAFATVAKENRDLVYSNNTVVRPV